MSQSLSSSMATNNSTKLSNATADNKANSPTSQQGIKRIASGQLEGTPKRPASNLYSCKAEATNLCSCKAEATNLCSCKAEATNLCSCKAEAPNLAPKSFHQVKFISAGEMIRNVRANVQLMPEIPDEELLKMALEFEKKHPQ